MHRVPFPGRGGRCVWCALSTVTDATGTQPGGNDGEPSYSSLFIIPRGGSATPGADPTVLVPATRVSIAGPEHAMPGNTKVMMTRALNSVARFMSDPPLRAGRPAAPVKYSTGRAPVACNGYRTVTALSRKGSVRIEVSRWLGRNFDWGLPVAPRALS